MFLRPTIMADAFLRAAVKDKKIDHSRGTGPWIPRRVLMNAERKGFGIVTEYDKRPNKEPHNHDR